VPPTELELVLLCSRCSQSVIAVFDCILNCWHYLGTHCVKQQAFPLKDTSSKPKPPFG